MDNRNRYDYDRDEEQRKTASRAASWLSLLLIPLAFIAGWEVNDALDTSSDNFLNLGTGIGGGPEDAIPTDDTGSDTGGLFEMSGPTGMTGTTGPIYEF